MFREFGNTLPRTQMMDPDGNETVYEWQHVEYYCPDSDCPSDPWCYNWWRQGEDGNFYICPLDDNSLNGRLRNISFYQGDALDQNLRKKEILNYYYNTECGFPSPQCYEGAHEGQGLGCHWNQHIMRANIRHGSKETRLYGPSGLSGGYVVMRETVDTYDDYGNVTQSTSHVEGLYDIVVNREYQVVEELYEDNPSGSRYKKDFLTLGIMTQNGDLISKTKYSEHGSAEGRIGDKKMYSSDGVFVQVEYDYDNGEDEGNGPRYKELKSASWKNALMSESGQYSDFVTKFTFESGVMDQKYIEDDEGTLFLVRNEIDANTGLIRTSTDASGNVTAFEYDGLSRMWHINPPGPDRLSITVQFENQGKTIRYERTDWNEYTLPFQTFKLDDMGNIAFHQQWVYDEAGYNPKTMVESKFDWRGNEIISMYLGNPGNLTHTYYDCLNRIWGIDDPDPNCTIFSYELHSDGAIQQKKIVTDDENVTRTYYSDLRGNLREVVVSDETRQSGNATYDYDARNNLIRVERGDRVRQFMYDWLNRMTQSLEPETGHNYFMYYPDGKLMLGSYDPDYLANGTKAFWYDSRNRLSKVKHLFTGTFETVSELNYDDPLVNFDNGSENGIDVNPRNYLGRLTSRKDYNFANGALTGETQFAMSYNVHGQLTDEWIQAKSGSFVSDVFRTGYSYNDWGGTSLIQYPAAGFYVSYGNEGAWTKNVKLLDNTHPEGIRDIARTVYYNPTGTLREIQYDNNAIMGLIPDNRNRTEWNSAIDDESNVLFHKQYKYDQVDRITQIGNPITQIGKKYIYHTDGSLDQVTDLSDFVLVDYEYDNNGNMTDRVVTNDVDRTFQDVAFSNYNRVTTAFNGKTFNYDFRGNVTFNPITNDNYLFNYDNRLMEVYGDELNAQHHKFVYDGDGCRRLHVLDDSIEMMFYDQSGTSLMEKLTYLVDSEDEAKVVKDECYINLGANNLAQFDYFEPVVTIGFPTNPEMSTIYPGEEFAADFTYEYHGEDTEVFVIVMLEVAGKMFFWPDWKLWDDGPTITPMTLSAGHGRIPFIDPVTFESLPDWEGLRFYAFFATSQVQGVVSVFGNMAVREFALSSGIGDYYVAPGPVNGKGKKDDPFNDINYAIQKAENDPGHQIIKLLPGTYELGIDEHVIIGDSEVSLIGSGQNRTFITSVDPESTIGFTNNQNVVLQGFTSSINIACDHSMPEIRNVRLINNDSLVGLWAINHSAPILRNCLITGYFEGVVLQESSAEIYNCTIDSCILADPDNPDLPGCGVAASCDNHDGYVCGEAKSVIIENSIITNNEIGIAIGNNVNLSVSYSNINGNILGNFVGADSQIGINGNISVAPKFTTKGDDHYYLSSMSAGQSVNSPCINAGVIAFDLRKAVGGTTRTDGVFDQCRRDMGYHYPRTGELVGVRNIDNDVYELDDPKSLLKSLVTTSKSEKDPELDLTMLYSAGPKDLIFIDELEGIGNELKILVSEDCGLVQSAGTGDSTTVKDAAIGDMDGDGTLDVVVADDTGASLYLNDGAGLLTFDQKKQEYVPNKVETLDFDRDGKRDIALATEQGVMIQRADDYLAYTAYQLIPSGDTMDMAWSDFDGDGDEDLVAIDATGSVQFFRNDRMSGFHSVGNPVRVMNSGDLTVRDATNDGQLDVLVEVTPTVYEIVEVKDIFGSQPLPEAGQREMRFVLFDHLGSAKMLLNDQCDVVWPDSQSIAANELLPFGQEMEVRPDTTEKSYNLNFTNKEIDRALELNYFGARYYHPGLPRFISPDPVSGTLGIPLSWNRYLYCRNDPVNLIDPSGENAVVTQETDAQCNVTGYTVSVSTEYVYDSNSYTADQAGQVAANLEEIASNYWNSQDATNEGIPVTFEFTYSVRSTSESATSGFDQLAIDPGQGTSNIVMTMVSDPSKANPVDTGTIFMGNGNNPTSPPITGVMPHERGHQMGLRDMYSGPVPINNTPAGDIMKFCQPNNSGAQWTPFIIQGTTNWNVRRN